MTLHRFARSLMGSIALLAFASASHGAELNVFAAASLSDALRDIAVGYEKDSGDRIRLNLGGSSMLARQIKEGAPADIFLSADEAKMDDLEKSGLIAPDTRKVLLSNTLVIVVHVDGGAAVSTPQDLAADSVRRLALAETETVPAGIYARAYLTRLGLWDRLSAKVVALDNVRATLAAVEAGNADAAIVYKTDALISKKVTVAFEVPMADGPRIAYPVAVVKNSTHDEAARRLSAYLASDEAIAVFSRYGFISVQ